MSLIYLHEKDKRPRENRWTKNENKTWKELKSEFNPKYNLGVRLGAYSPIADRGYLCCIDVDVKDPAFKDAALTKLREIVGSETYPEVRSGSGNGSRHIYCVSREPFKMIEIEKHKDQWEICAYSTGRQVVLPPSIHPSGKPYKWVSPFDVDTLFTFDPDEWRKVPSTEITNSSGGELNFKAQDVNLWEGKLSTAMVQLIEDGANSEDGSAEIMSVALAMCRYGYTDNQILSVLSDPQNYLAKVGYEHTKSRDRLRAVTWLYRYTLLKARFDTDIMRKFDNPPVLTPLTKKEAKEVNSSIEADIALVFPDVEKSGKPKTTLRNLVHALEEFMGGGLVAFNEFNNRPYFMKDTPYGGVKGNEIADHDDVALKHYMATRFRFEPSINLCVEAHCFVARKYMFHPVRTYLKSLEWDETPRLDNWLMDAFNASGPDDYLKAVSRKVLVAAVARVMEPGCKFDYVMVLEGNQGEGKSMSLGMLASQAWFTDGLGDIHNKDVVDQMTGKWIIELSELASIRGRENEYVKAFLSRQVDRVRISYGRRSQDYCRQSIFIGSTNSSEYLTDETGNRRYWPVKVGEADRRWLELNRDQLWAEAMVRFNLGEDLYLPKPIERVAKREQEKRFDVDEWEAELLTIVKNGGTDEKFITTELWRAINLTNVSGHPSDHECKRIGRVMRRLGYRRGYQKEDGVVKRCWVKGVKLSEVRNFNTSVTPKKPVLGG